MGPKWVEHLPAVLWADRVTIRQSMGFAPYKLVFGQDCILLVEFEAITYAMIDWRSIHTKEQLLVARAWQFERREDNLELAAKRLKANRQVNKQFFDSRHRKRQGNVTKGDIVLLYNSCLDKQWLKKLDNRWNGPYLVVGVKKARGTYLLSELDGTIMDGVFLGEQLKCFFSKERCCGRCRRR